MVAQTGHVAVIVPDFATRAVEPNEIGVHLYLGNGWRTWTGKRAAKQIFVRRLL
jgi:hypothetical protein